MHFQGKLAAGALHGQGSLIERQGSSVLIAVKPQRLRIVRRHNPCSGWTEHNRFAVAGNECVELPDTGLHGRQCLFDRNGKDVCGRFPVLSGHFDRGLVASIRLCHDLAGGIHIEGAVHWDDFKGTVIRNPEAEKLLCI